MNDSDDVKMVRAQTKVMITSFDRRNKVEKEATTHDAVALFLSNRERNSTNCVVRYINAKGNIAFGLMPLDRLILEDIQEAESDFIEVLRAEVMATIVSVPKAVMIVFLSHQNSDVNEALGWRDVIRVRTPWPEGVNFVKFVKASVSLGQLKEVGFTPLLLREMINTGIIQKVSATE